MVSQSLEKSFNPLNRGNSNQIQPARFSSVGKLTVRFNPLNRGNSNQILINGKYLVSANYVVSIP